MDELMMGATERGEIAQGIGTTPAFEVDVMKVEPATLGTTSAIGVLTSALRLITQG